MDSRSVHFKGRIVTYLLVISPILLGIELSHRKQPHERKIYREVPVNHDGNPNRRISSLAAGTVLNCPRAKGTFLAIAALQTFDCR